MGGDKSGKSNNLPLSILPNISRLIEKLIADRLYQYMNKHNMFSSKQSGLRRLHSILTCLLKINDDWYHGKVDLEEILRVHRS